jgi:hypothetical protein
VTIGTRRAPAPEGRPGFIRIDSVHQGDLDGAKGLYHINAVNCVTQWEVTATVQTISEAHLLFTNVRLLNEVMRQSTEVSHHAGRLLVRCRQNAVTTRGHRANEKGRP